MVGRGRSWNWVAGLVSKDPPEVSECPQFGALAAHPKPQSRTRAGGQVVGGIRRHPR